VNDNKKSQPSLNMSGHQYGGPKPFKNVDCILTCRPLFFGNPMWRCRWHKKKKKERERESCFTYPSKSLM